jgi:hypothetical protein
LTYETPDYDTYDKTFHDKEAGMTESWVNLKVAWDFHPKRRHFFSLRQKEAEIKLLSARYSNTSTKMHDLSPVLDDWTLLSELDSVTTTTYLNVSLVKSEMRCKVGVDAATFAKNWGTGFEATKRTRLVTTRRGIIRIIHPSLTKRYKTNDLPVTVFTDTMYSTILSRQ